MVLASSFGRASRVLAGHEIPEATFQIEEDTQRDPPPSCFV